MIREVELYHLLAMACKKVWAAFYTFQKCIISLSHSSTVSFA